MTDTPTHFTPQYPLLDPHPASAPASAKEPVYKRFWRFGLIEELDYEGFSPAEAECGVSAIGYR